MKFSIADLLWESTRRNEDYKRFYFEVVGKEAPINWERIWHPGNYNWKIDGLLHPGITINDIKAKIESECEVKLVHPYYYISKPIVQCENIEQILESFFKIKNHIKNDDYQYQCYIKNIIDRYSIETGRVLFSLDLMGDDSKIINMIKSLKKEFRKKYKLACVNNVKKLFNPTKINSYIMWLKKYDEIVNYLNNQYGRDNLRIDSGAVMTPDKFSFKEVVPGDTNKIFETAIKAMKEAYEGSVLLIQQTPNIKFSMPRT